MARLSKGQAAQADEQKNLEREISMPNSHCLPLSSCMHTRHPIRETVSICAKDPLFRQHHLAGGGEKFGIQAAEIEP